jgi:hypothetical protein
MLDFKGISEGQPFPDEIFRVFQRSHPSIKIIPLRTNEDVDWMIKHALANAASSTEAELHLPTSNGSTDE